MKKIFSVLKKETITTDEKIKLSNAVSMAMKNFPAKETGFDFKQWLSFLQPRLRYGMAVISLVLIFIMSGGSALAAEAALPGDLLYSVKINLNERLRGSLAINTEAKVAWEIEKTERRLNEIEQLASQSRLRGNVVVEAEQHYEGQMNKVQQSITSLEKNGDKKKVRELKKEFVEIKQDHEIIIEKITTEYDTGDETVEKPIQNLINKIKIRLDAVAAIDTATTLNVEESKNKKGNQKLNDENEDDTVDDTQKEREDHEKEKGNKNNDRQGLTINTTSEVRLSL